MSELERTLAGLREWMAAIEAMAAATHRDGSWEREQAAYRALTLDLARNVVQQHYIVLPAEPQPLPARGSTPARRATASRSKAAGK